MSAVPKYRTCANCGVVFAPRRGNARGQCSKFCSFAAKVGKPLDSGCIEWQGALRFGYGAFSWKPEFSSTIAHRIAYELAVGPIPPGLHACHRCDNRKCLNPAHIFLGTNNDNIADRVAKGRSMKGDSHTARTRGHEYLMRGEQVAGAKLTNALVVEIREMRERGMMAKEIAAIVGIDPVNVANVYLGKSWQHVGGPIAKPKEKHANRTGMKYGATKLSPEIVYAIRDAVGTKIEVGRRFGVHCGTVCDIQLRKTWKHLPERPTGAAC